MHVMRTLDYGLEWDKQVLTKLVHSK